MKEKEKKKQIEKDKKKEVLEDNKRMTRFQMKRMAEQNLTKNEKETTKTQNKNKKLKTAKDTNLSKPQKNLTNQTQNPTKFIKDSENEIKKLHEIMMFGGKFNSGRCKQILSDLRSGDLNRITEAVTSLANELSLAEEGFFGTSNLDLLIPELINCLKMENSPEIMIHSASALSNILEIAPNLSEVIVKHGGVIVLCEKMQNFKYIDIAEIAIKTLEKISRDNSYAILNAGGLPILIKLIDFFVINVQKSIVGIIANIFEKIPTEDCLVNEIFPALASFAFYLITDTYKNELFCNIYLKVSQKIMKFSGSDLKKKKNYFEIVFTDEIIQQLFQIFDKALNEENMNSHTKIGILLNIIRIFKKICFSSSKICLICFNLKLIEKLDVILTMIFKSSDIEQFSNILFHTILLINSILGFRSQPHPLMSRMASIIGIKIMEINDIEEKLFILKNHRHFFVQLVQIVFPKIADIYEFSNKIMVKYIVLIIMEKMLSLSEKTEIIPYMKNGRIYSFMTQLMSSDDLMINSVFLLIIQIFLEKIPEVYMQFYREGIIDKLEKLSDVKTQPKLQIYMLINRNNAFPLTHKNSFAQKYMSLNNILQKTDMKNDILAMENKNEFPQFSNFLNRRMNYLFNLNEEPKPNFYSNLGFSNFQPNLNNPKDQPHPPNPGRPKKRNNKSLKEPEFKSFKESEFKSYKEPEFKPLKENPEEKTSLLEENNSMPMNELDSLKPLFPLKNNSSFWELNDKITQNKDLSKEDSFKKDEDNHEKTDNICKEISMLAKEILLKINKCNLCKNFENEMLAFQKKFESLNQMLLNSHAKTDNNLEIFKKIEDFFNENSKITGYELCKNRFCENFLEFVFEGALSTIYEITQGPKNSENIDAFINTDNFEMKCIESEHDLNNEISQTVQTSILKRIIAFYFYFSKHSLNESKDTYMEIILHNLQEILSNLECSSNNTPQNDNDFNLEQDFNILSTREKIKVKFRDSQELSMKKLRDFNSSSKDQKEIYEKLEYLNARFRDIPFVILTAEAHHTLEVFEDYLLNSINERDSLSLSSFAPSKNSLIPESKSAVLQKVAESDDDDLDDELEIHEDEDEDDDVDEEDDYEMNLEELNFKSNRMMPQKNQENSLKSGGSNSINKLPSEKMSLIPEPSLSLSEKSSIKKNLLKKFFGKEINYKKNFEIEFFLNGTKLSKLSTIYSIIHKSNKKNRSFSLDDPIQVEFQCKIKHNENISSEMEIETDSFSHDKIFNPSNFLFHLIKSLEIKDISSENSFENLTKYSLIQMIQFISFLNTNNYFDDLFNSPFYFSLTQMKNDPKYKDLIEQTFVNSKLSLINLKNSNNFMNKKISQNLARKLKEPLTVASGELSEFYKYVLVQKPFLLDPLTKILYYKNFTFHKSRSFFYLYQNNKARLKNFESFRIGKLHRKKIKIFRSSILDDSLKISSYYLSDKHILEFEFFHEEGSGLGPTLEYYSLIAQEIKKDANQILRITDDGALFPKPKQITSKDLELFEFIGLIIARAILDERILDLPLNPVFWKLILKQKVDFSDFKRIEKKMGEIVMGFQALVIQKNDILDSADWAFDEKMNKINALRYNGCKIEDMGINFTYPGFPDFELVENGKDLILNIDNIDLYVDSLSKAFFKESIARQVQAFVTGFNKILNIEHLKMFSLDEINLIYTGSSQDEYWSLAHMYQYIVPNYGYSQKSEAYVNFIKILNGFSEEEREYFLMFVTGASRLPLGGFKTLNPRLTIVKKTSTSYKVKNDEILLSVMTCQNYVKLPEYTNYEIMKERILYAIKEGRNTFALS